jgi:hypothetical protein
MLLARALVPFTLFCSLQATSIVPIRSGVPLHGDMQGDSLQNYYVFNVSGSTENSRLTISLRQMGGSRNSGLVLSVCPGMLPCGDLGCDCPSRFVDPQPEIDDAIRSPGHSSELRVDINPCDLTEGAWYISVELPAVAKDAEDWDRATAFYDLTATLEDARLALGQVCCRVTNDNLLGRTAERERQSQRQRYRHRHRHRPRLRQSRDPLSLPLLRTCACAHPPACAQRRTQLRVT